MEITQQVNVVKTENTSLQLLEDWFVKLMGKEIFLEDKLERVELEVEEEENKIFEIKVPAELCGREPVSFCDGWDDDIDFENLDEGANLGKENKDDANRMRSIIEEKMKDVDIHLFNGSQEKKQRYVEMLKRHASCFGDGDSPTKLSDLTPINCTLEDGKSVGVLKQHPVGPEQEQFLHRRVEQMLKASMIRVNTDPTTAMSVMVVPKKGPKRFRLVVDFRPLNSITKRVSNTLPKLDLQFNRARGRKLYAAFDLLSGFDYLKCTEQAGKYFTFTTPWGIAYSFNGAPQGWCNTPSLFNMRQIEEVLIPSKLWPHHSMQWIDDTTIMAEDVDELQQYVDQYLTQISKKNLRINIDKCHLIAEEVVFCGRKLNKNGFKFDSTYATGLLERKKPKYLHELAQFIYTANFLCSIIPQFSRIRKAVIGKFKITGRLKNLERKKILLDWSPELTTAFDELIKVLKRSLQSTLGYYNYKEDLYIFSDASDCHWGLYITQISEKVDFEEPLATKFRIIAMSSGSFVGSQINWHISSKELYPAVIALKKYPYYLLFNAHRKIFFTDHRNLVRIISPKDVKIKAYAARIGRWAADFMRINLEVYHLEGYKNVPADILSRWLNPNYSEANDEGKIKYLKAVVYDKDETEYWKRVDEYHVSHRHPSNNKPVAGNWPIMDELFVLEMQKRDKKDLKEVLKQNGKIVLTENLIASAILHVHSLFNHGAKKLEWAFIRKNYVVLPDLLKLLKATIDRMHLQCMHCQRRSLVVRRPINLTKLGSKARSILYADFLYINPTGWVLTIIDSLTRISSLSYVKVPTAVSVVQGLWKFNASFSLAKQFMLVTDQGSHFVNKLVDAFLKSCNGTHYLTAAYCSQTAGTVEVQNREVLKHLRCLVSDLGLTREQWPDILDMVQSYMNSSPLRCRGLEEQTPFELLFGEKLGKSVIGSSFEELGKAEIEMLKTRAAGLNKRIFDLQKKAFKKGLLYRHTAHKRYNKRLLPINFHKGEYVWLSEKTVDSSNKDKCRPRWSGPYQIVEIVSEHIYEVMDQYGTKKTRHASLMVPFAPSSFLPNANTQAVFITDKGKLAVDSIKDIMKKEDGEILVRVAWKGFDELRDTWETLVIIFEDVPLLLKQYFELNKENDLVKEAVYLLKTLFPTSEWISSFNIFAVKDEVYIELEEWKHKLLKGKIFVAPNGRWSQEGWSQVEFNILNILVMKFGMGSFSEYRKYLPGKNKQQMYNKMQRYIGVQSLEHFQGLKVNLNYLRSKLYEKGCYKKKILPYTERQQLLKRYLTLWRFGSEKMKSNGNGIDLNYIFDIMRLPGLYKLRNAICCCRKNKDTWKGYPTVNGDLKYFEDFVNDFVKAFEIRLKKISKYVKLVSLAVEDDQFESQEKSKGLLGISDQVAPNLFSFTNIDLGVQGKIWKVPRGSKMLNMKVQDFLRSTKIKPQVIVVDFPYNLFPDDPIRGPSNKYDQMKDKDIMALDINPLEDNLWFVWTLTSKRDLALEWFKKNKIRFMSRLLWAKTSKSGKLLSTLGNISGACVEECLIGLRGRFPIGMRKRFIGKELFFGRKYANSMKPVELYEMIERMIGNNFICLELFGRMNNVRKNWVTVGKELNVKLTFIEE
eukprot:snap_masked-scaffold_1-processed-gene-15.23-mRNA-1 protein AED:0.47 eAED:0.47 QI:0/-1/0/1/-1/1/1/0/1610